MSENFPDIYLFKENSDQFDLDFFLYDTEKIIHISTAGMELKNSIGEFNFNPISNFQTVLSYRRIFRYETIKNLNRDNLTSVEDYLYFFKFMAKRGFYSYDKVNIDEPDDYTFQLIAKPFLSRKIYIPKLDLYRGNLNSERTLNYDLNFIEARKNFPVNFEEFDILEFI